MEESRDPRAWNLSAMEQRVLEEELSRAVRRLVSGQAVLPGQQHPVAVRVTLVPAERIAVVDLGAGYVPREWSPDFEDANHAVYLLVAETLQARYPVRGVRFTCEGRALEEYFPEIFPGHEAGGARRTDTPAG